MKFTFTGVQTDQVVFDAAGADAATGLSPSISIFNGAASAAEISVKLVAPSGKLRYAVGREPTIPPGGAIKLRWNQLGIWQVLVTTAGSATVYIAPSDGED